MRKISQQQLMCMAFVGLLSPIIRLLPEHAVNRGGYVTWLSPIVALVPVLIFDWYLSYFLKNRQEGEGMVEMMQRSLGSTGGRIMCAVYGAWLIFYAGFVLRYGGERLMTSIFGDDPIAPFIVLLLLISVILASGPIRSIARSSQIFVIVVLVMLGIVFLFAGVNVSKENLLPVTHLDAADIVRGTEPIVALMSCYFYYTFLMGHMEKRDNDAKVVRHWILLLTAVVFCILGSTIGNLSAELILDIKNPFFTMVQDISAFGIIERMEAVAVTLWCISDVVYMASMLLAIKELWAGAFNRKPNKWYVLVPAVAALATALFVLPEPFKLQVLSDGFMLYATIIMTAGVSFVIFLIGKIRKKI